MAKRTFEDGIAIFRSIAESDAFKEMRGRIRDGASRVAESDRVPRVLAGSAGIVAALLTDVDEVDEEIQFAEDLEPMVEEPSEMVVPSSVEMEDEGDDLDDEDVPDSVATVRDLDGAAALDAPPEPEEEDELEDEEGPLGYVRSDEEPDGLSEATDEVAMTQPKAVVAPAPATKPKAVKPKAPSAKSKTSKKRGSTAALKATKSANAAGGAAKRAASVKKGAAKKATKKAASEASGKAPAKKASGKAAAKKERGEATTKREAPSKSGGTKKPVGKSPRVKSKKSS